MHIHPTDIASDKTQACVALLLEAQVTLDDGITRLGEQKTTEQKHFKV